MGQYQTEKFLHSESNNHQNKKIPCQKGESIFASYIEQGADTLDLQRDHSTKQQKKKVPNKKLDRRAKLILLQRKHINNKQALDKMLIIIRNCKANAQ